jgi:hypothetical protein
MSNLPELPFLEEILDISNSIDFFTFTKQQFEQTWQFYQDQLASDDWTSTHKRIASDPRPSVTCNNGVNLSDRNAWDPMLLRQQSMYIDSGMEINESCMDINEPGMEINEPNTEINSNSDHNLVTLTSSDLISDRSSFNAGICNSEGAHCETGVFEDSSRLTDMKGNVTLTSINIICNNTLQPSVSIRKTRPRTPRSLQKKLFAKEPRQSRQRSTSTSGGAQQKLAFPLRKRRRMTSLNRKNNLVKREESKDVYDEILFLRSQNKKLKRQAHFDRKKLSDAQLLIKTLKSHKNAKPLVCM